MDTKETGATHTAASIAAIITKNIEPQTAEAVLAALQPLNGQAITTRLLDKLPGGRVEWRLNRTHGWTEIRNRAYLTSHGSSPEALLLILARSESSVPLSVKWVERENPSYFRGRRERNAMRATALDDTELLRDVAWVMNKIEDLHVKLTATKQDFTTLTAPGTPLSPDRYDLERACGLRDAKDAVTTRWDPPF